MAKSKQRSPASQTPPASSESVSFDDAQTQARAALPAGRGALMGQIITVLSSKVHMGKPVSPHVIAQEIGGTTSRADIRHTFQRAGLSGRKNPLLEEGRFWIQLTKVKGQNQYQLMNKGTNLEKAAASTTS